MTKHSAASLVHVPYSWTYADQTDREAATGLVPGDVGKLSRQLDDNTLWMLTDDSPVTWVAVGGGGGGGAGSIVFVESHVASASATLDFVLLDDTYNDYLLKITGLRPGTSGQDLIMRFANAITPTWDAGNNYRWAYKYWSSAGAEGIVADGGATSGIKIAVVASTTAGYSINAEIHFSNFRTAGLYKRANAKLDQQLSSDSNLYSINTSGWWLDNTNKAFGIRLLMSSGNIASGAAYLYGIKDS